MGDCAGSPFLGHQQSWKMEAPLLSLSMAFQQARERRRIYQIQCQAIALHLRKASRRIRFKKLWGSKMGSFFGSEHIQYSWQRASFILRSLSSGGGRHSICPDLSKLMWIYIWPLFSAQFSLGNGHLNLLLYLLGGRLCNYPPNAGHVVRSSEKISYLKVAGIIWDIVDTN